MKKIGLALSGGGFRASLYHLGLIRFLRDAGILPHVSHITSVSGGSILAAHLVLNWDRYNGSPNDFETAAAELLSFVGLDIRNRIIRRFPLTLFLRFPRRLMGCSNRKLTRTGLLEYHYEQYLYGDISLFELPEKPQLHILATNLSEGCLCSFNRNGLIMVRHRADNAIRLDRIHIGLATVPMAVTASSAFPGFFPPVELTGADVGAAGGEFGRQAYTDGGVFDNLGIRMFRCLERSLLADTLLSREDFVDFSRTVEALSQAGQAGEETPLRRVSQLLLAAGNRAEPLLLSGPAMANKMSPISSSEAAQENGEARVLSCLWDLLRHYPLHREPIFVGLKSADRDVDSLLNAIRYGKGVLPPDDQLWLNRHLLEAAFRQATGLGCFNRLNSGLDGILVSDVGKPFEVKPDRRAGGLIQTAMRATDIVMDRVWQLEIETFHDTPGFVFAPVTDMVDPAEDPTALHPEVQRQAAHIRTDLDRFSPLEISALVRHGYCVGRKACRARTELFGANLPEGAPWDPAVGQRVAARSGQSAQSASSLPFSQPAPGIKGPPAPETTEARTLQRAGQRHIWSSLLDFRDWVSYIYVPIIIPILVLLPWFVTKSYERAHRIDQIVESLSQGYRDLEQMSQLMDGPVPPFTGVPPEEVHALGSPDFNGFAVLQDMRILDLRNWKPTASARNDPSSMLYAYRRLKVVKTPENSGNHQFRLLLLLKSPTAQVRFPPQEVPGSAFMAPLERSDRGLKEGRWEASWNLEKIPVGNYVDLIVEERAPGMFLRRGEISTTLSFQIQTETAEVTRWLLLPRDHEYRRFTVVRYITGIPEKVEPVKIVTHYLAEDSSILAYKMLSVDGGYTYEVTWYYK